MLLGDVPVDEAWLPVLLDQADWMLAMLAGAPALTRFAETLRAVMQWWDGTGPEGLEGSRIPLGARIVAVADAYDVIGERRRACGSPRVGHPLSRRLEDEAGTRLDPDLVRVCLHLTAEGSCE